MRTILILREIASDDGMESQHVEVVCRDPSCMKVLHMGTGLKVYPGGAQGGNSGDQRGHVVAQQLPLLTVYISSLIRGFRPRSPGIDMSMRSG